MNTKIKALASIIKIKVQKKIVHDDTMEKEQCYPTVTQHTRTPQYHLFSLSLYR